MDFEIVTQGTKLKQLRERLGLLQENVSGNEITRNLISMIETDKATITKKATKIITDNLKKYSADKDIDIQQEIEYLVISEEDQAREIFKKFIEYIQSTGVNAENELNTMIDILNKYKLNFAKIEVYFQLGIVFKNVQLYEKAYKYFSFAKEFAVMTNEYGALYGEIIMNLLHCCIRLKMFNEGIFISDVVESGIPSELYARIMYNKATLYKATNQFDKAIKILNDDKIFSKKLKNNDLEIRPKLLMANCYREKGYYNKALNIHKKLYDKISNKKNIDKMFIILALENIIETSMILEETYTNYLDKLVEHISSYNEFDDTYASAEICKFVYLAFSKINSNITAKKYIIKALDLAKKHKNADVIDFAVNQLFDRALASGKESEVNLIKNELLELLSLGFIQPTSKLVILIIEYYIKHDNNKALQVIDFCKSKVS